MQNEMLDFLVRINPKIGNNPDSDLLAEGIIDSLDMMNIVSAAEEKFSITIGPGDMTEDNFRSVAAIAALLESKRKSADRQ